MMLLYFRAKYKQETHAHVFVLEELSASYRVSSISAFPREGGIVCVADQCLFSGWGGGKMTIGERGGEKKNKSVLPPFMIYS